MIIEHNTEHNERQRWISSNLPAEVQKTPRPYQRAVFQAFTTHLNKHKLALAHLATGAGKTYITMEWLRREIATGTVTTKKPIVWMVHRSSLLPQAMKELFAIPFAERKKLGLTENSIAILGHSLNQKLSNGRLLEGENNSTLVYFTTRQSFANIAPHFGRTPSFIVWDECHQGDAGSFQQGPKILKLFRRKRTKIIGLTATPKFNSCTFTESDVVYSKTLSDLIALGFLARPIPIQLDTHISWSPETGPVRNSDFTNLYVLNTPQRNQRIVQHYVDHKRKYGSTIVFAIDIAHVEELLCLFHEHNIAATAVHSKMNSSLVCKNIQDFRLGRKDVIINVAMLSEGFDAPELESIFMCRPTNSRTLYLQSIGRGTRISEGSTKKTFYVVDFVDNLTRHKESLIVGTQVFRNRGIQNRKTTSVQLRERISEGRHFFQTGGTPSYICREDNLPDSMQDFWFYPEQTFGFEIELTAPGWYNRSTFKRMARRIITELSQVLGVDKVHQQVCTASARIATRWNVEKDASCGWEVVSPVLQGIDGISEMVSVLKCLDTLTEETPLTVNFTTGLHLHLGFSGATVHQLKSLIVEMHKVEPMLAAIVSQSRINTFLGEGLYTNHPNQYCTPIRSQITKKALQNSTTRYALLKAFKSRYSTLNLKSMSRIQTVEFRFHNGTTDALKVVRWLSLCQQVFHQAIRQGDWTRDLGLYSRRRVIEPATISQLKNWVGGLPGGHKDNFVNSLLARAQEVKRYEALDQ